MTDNYLSEYYEKDAQRFWAPEEGLRGRDEIVMGHMRPPQGTVLEYGCGSGSLLLHMAGLKGVNRAIGYDISANLLAGVTAAAAKMQLPEDRVEVYLPEADKVPQVADASVDTLVCVATIEHVINPYTVLDELNRVARPGAELICSVPNLGYIKHILDLIRGRQPRTGTDLPVSEWREDGWDGMHLHTFTQSSFSTLLRDCGWNPVGFTGWGSRLSSLGLGTLRRKYPGKWSGEIIARCVKIK
jgi:SAM-dependent methyltransferase